MASGWMNAPTHGITQQRQRKPTQGFPPAPPLPSLPAVHFLVATKAAFDQGLRFRYEALRIRRGLGVLRIPHPSPPPPPKTPPSNPQPVAGAIPGPTALQLLVKSRFFLFCFCFFVRHHPVHTGASPGFGVADIHLLQIRKFGLWMIKRYLVKYQPSPSATIG